MWWENAINPQGQIGILTLPSSGYGLSNMFAGMGGGPSAYGMNTHGVPAPYAGNALYFRRSTTSVPNQCPIGYRADKNGNCRARF
ncbi:hypothetical protein K1T71_003981 [Dendrolimus kikuchii]|uniref:Uncharacterized protein n=1 Tax=Dendrolimus kikuchii TaxID=765133 RepID=A0ACC1DAZ6_9NEOP|nr:hypothetical protein K1T71_003981 [Dendrolimus kikuchii]